MKLPAVQLLHSPVTSSLLGLNILSTLFSNTLSLCCCLILLRYQMAVVVQSGCFYWCVGVVG
jgi:hypothetical protein